LSIFHSGIDLPKVREIYGREGVRLHFIGVGGVGMYPLARASLEDGKRVTGYDARRNALTDDLLKRGADIRIGERRENIKDVDLIIFTLAASESDPEIVRAEELGIPTASRAEFLGAIMSDYKTRLGVSGSHGKSTVTAMVDAIAKSDGRAPTTFVGASLFDTGLPIRLGGKELLIYEGCEYKDAFLRFSPTASVYTSLELDHTDYFMNMEALAASFTQSIRSCPLPVIRTDDERLREIAGKLRGKYVSYGFERGDITASATLREKGRYSLKIRHGSVALPEILLNVSGRYNAENALSAAALSLSSGMSEDAVCGALADFSGVERRMQYIGRVGEHRFFYDYAHHPTEIKAALLGLREAEDAPITVIFKPHTFSRTSSFLGEFANALSIADRAVILDIDPVREAFSDKVSSASLAAAIGKNAALATDAEALSLALSYPPSSVVIMGAGDTSKVISDFKGAIRVEKMAGNSGE
jgi:UDP-N-acetylmuramate--alanine ligase